MEDIEELLLLSAPLVPHQGAALLQGRLEAPTQVSLEGCREGCREGCPEDGLWVHPAASPSGVLV